VKLWVPVVKFRIKTIQLGAKSVNSSQIKSKPSPPNKRKLFIGLASAVILIIMVGFVWHTLNAPNYGDIAKISPETTSTTKLPEYTTLTTNFYTLNYSERYQQAASNIPPAGVLDQKILAYQLGGQPGQSKIEILVKAAPDGGVTLDSSYDYYLKHPEQFKLSNKYYHGEAVDIARSTKSVSPETTAIWLHDGYLMTIKITTADTQQDIDSELKDVLSSVQWRN